MRNRLNTRRIITGNNRPIKNTPPDFICELCGKKGWLSHLIEYASHFRIHDERGSK